MFSPCLRAAFLGRWHDTSVTDRFYGLLARCNLSALSAPARSLAPIQTVFNALTLRVYPGPAPLVSASP
jgi:hypothetical protein